MEEEKKRIHVAITHGDTNGIGYEMIFKTFAEQDLFDFCTPIIYGSPKVAAYHRKMLDLPANFSIVSQAEDIYEGRLNLLTCFEEEVKVEVGQPSREAGGAAQKALERAADDYAANAYDIMVTAPINKGDMPDETFPFYGHADFLESRIGNGQKSLVVLVNDNMRVASLTTGKTLAEAPSAVNQANIEEKATLLWQTLKRDFRISNPRIAILALNPKTDSCDFVGSEEREQIAPAVAALAKRGIQAFGPYASDDIFADGAYRHFDGILAMHQEQAATPFRALAQSRGVRLLAGLPLVCTAPDIEVGYDIAGKCVANPDAFRQALYLAIDIYRNRKEYDLPQAHPLPKLYHERRDDSEKVRFARPKQRPEKSNADEAETPE